ncbi:MAG: triose-phosphate isomerase [bacterium]|nr:triose-phosphate isomerase [bacterium]
MKKQKVLVVGNWKMNPATLSEAKALFAKVKRVGAGLRNVETVLCPPFVFLSVLSGVGVKLGSQDVFWQNGGRFTGEISPEMLKNLGVSYCIVGHSERRAIGETDDDVSKKVNAALKENLKVVMCIGERERDSSGAYFEFIKNQLKKSLAGVQPRFLSDLIIAYEPIWAIGKSFRESMTPADIKEMTIFIQKVLSDSYDRKMVTAIPIIYGAAVEPENVAAVLQEGGVAGVLVGHKSLMAEDFITILKSANLPR